jgi:hypothetical protein
MNGRNRNRPYWSKFIFIALIFLCNLNFILAQKPTSPPRTKVYLIPGQGFDYRVFNNLELTENFDTVYIHYVVPDKKSELKQYARILAQKIDTTEKFSLIGVSFGGMVCSEMCEFLNPEKVILISSAKARKEIPLGYKMFKYLPINLLIPGFLYKASGQILRPIFEPDEKLANGLFKDMLHSSNNQFMKQSTKMIINWNKKTFSDKIIHIHGTSDNTLPFRNIKTNYTINKGSHMMVFTRSEEINAIVNKILNAD